MFKGTTQFQPPHWPWKKEWNWKHSEMMKIEQWCMGLREDLVKSWSQWHDRGKEGPCFIHGILHSTCMYQYFGSREFCRVFKNFYFLKKKNFGQFSYQKRTENWKYLQLHDEENLSYDWDHVFQIEFD